MDGEQWTANRQGPDRNAIRTLVVRAYLPWQQLSVQPSWQHDWPHWPWQQLWQLIALAAGACAIAVTARTVANEINARVRFICFFSLTVPVKFRRHTSCSDASEVMAPYRGRFKYA